MIFSKLNGESYCIFKDL